MKWVIANPRSGQIMAVLSNETEDGEIEITTYGMNDVFEYTDGLEPVIDEYEDGDAYLCFGQMFVNNGRFIRKDGDDDIID